MNIINTQKLTYNDNDEIRLFASEQFNWYLQKNTGVSCSWGTDIKETPQYDPIGPQEILWKITSFNLKDYLIKFNFLANIKKKKDDNILSIDLEQNILENQNSYICMSTLSNIIFILDSLDNIDMQKFKLFCDYIRYFNININIQYNLTNYQIGEVYDKIYQISCRLILNIQSNIFNASNLLKLIDMLKDKFNISLKLHINNDSNIQISKLIEKIDSNISCMLYNQFPYLSTRKFLNMQSKILSKKLLNVCLTQCSKKHYSNSIIGSIILQLPCSACRYTLYLEDFNIFDCEINKNKIGNLSDFDTLDKVWNAEKIIQLRSKLIDTNKC